MSRSFHVLGPKLAEVFAQRYDFDKFYQDEMKIRTDMYKIEDAYAVRSKLKTPIGYAEQRYERDKEEVLYMINEYKISPLLCDSSPHLQKYRII
jgi:hypothetical protein